MDKREKDKRGKQSKENANDKQKEDQSSDKKPGRKILKKIVDETLFFTISKLR